MSARLCHQRRVRAVDEIVNSWLLAHDPGDLTRFHAPLMDFLSAGMEVRRK